ncbi:hypothetical protein EON79_18325 [bacterium]|nr:MAG: hypothetical protein EON79_18325 [bacterium]
MLWLAHQDQVNYLKKKFPLGLMAKVGPPRFFLDLRNLPPALRPSLNLIRPWRNIGSEYSEKNPTGYYEPLNPVELFDGVVFLDKLTGARGLP